MSQAVEDTTPRVVEDAKEDSIEHLVKKGTRSLSLMEMTAAAAAAEKAAADLYPFTGLTMRHHYDDAYRVKLLTGNSNRPLAESVAKMLGMHLEACEVGQFANGEININIEDNIRGADVFILQPVCGPDVNTRLMEMLLLLHTCKLASAKRITAVMAHYGYARQDRKPRPRVPISASAVAQMLQTMGADRIITVDLHSEQIQGFFYNTPVDNLYAESLFVKHLRSKQFDMDKLVVVSPDAGGVTRARRVADLLNANSVVTILKRRVKANVVESMQIVGDVEGMTAVIVDDMIDTAGTLCKAAELLKERGATRILACASHGVFSEPAMDRINASVLEEVIVTDSIPQEDNVKRCSKLVVLSLAQLLAEAILRVHNEKSLSILFKQ